MEWPLSLLLVNAAGELTFANRKHEKVTPLFNTLNYFLNSFNNLNSKCRIYIDIATIISDASRW